jgi:uncharacterized membrane protein YphA (DoxX/SURF4 family)
MKNFFLMIGRICLSLFFITTVVSQILNWDVSHQQFVETVCNWLSYPGLASPFVKFFHLLLSYSWLCLLFGMICLGAGALLVLLGIKVRLGAGLLILCLLPATLIMDAFWLSQEGRELLMMQFLKNLSILGGLFILTSSDGAP